MDYSLVVQAPVAPSDKNAIDQPHQLIFFAAGQYYLKIFYLVVGIQFPFKQLPFIFVIKQGF